MSHYATKPGLFPMQGGCPCGLVRFQLELPPLIVHCCHCTACQLQQGSAFALNAVIESSNLTLLPPRSPPSIPGGGNCDLAPSPPMPTSASSAVAKLANASFPAHLASQHHAGGDSDMGRDPTQPVIVTVPSTSGVGQHIAHCPDCHAGLWSYYADGGPNVPYVRVGTLDRASEVDPDVHIYTRTMRRSIISLSDGKPVFEGYYPDRAAFYRDDCKARVMALESHMKVWKQDMRKALGL